ncbi:MAG: hypothetical protein LBL09_00505 [Oscillospiraceae bacterium]|nr:hypothetical protein [Oscillospiraceae bacterium]
MKLPPLKYSEQITKGQLIAFGGLNYSEGAREGELSDSIALSSRNYPSISQRKGRRRLEGYTSPTALFSKGALCVVDGDGFHYDGVRVGSVAEGEKYFASIGNKVVIFPDKLYYDIETGEFGGLEELYISSVNQITFTSNSIITSGAPFSFAPGDAVEITGCSANPENNKLPIIREATGGTLTFYDNTFTAGAEPGSIRIHRKVPDLAYICESNNRIWGVSGQTVYGSALGDPFNFHRYDGLSTDSFAVAVGSDGEFTGVVPYASHICFFKEDALHKLYGSKPSNYQISTSQVQGIQRGCAKSARVINETLFFKGRGGVYAYTGGVPELISVAFGTKRFDEAAAEGDGETLYVSMKSEGKWGLYTFDTLRGFWLKEDDTEALDFTFLDGTVYFINAKDNGIYAITDEKEMIPWLCELAPFTEASAEKKGYSRLSVQFELEDGAWLAVEVNTDGSGWKTVYTTHDERARVFYVPIFPARCDSFQVRFSGIGGCKIRSLTRYFHRYQS